MPAHPHPHHHQPHPHPHHDQPHPHSNNTNNLIFYLSFFFKCISVLLILIHITISSLSRLSQSSLSPSVLSSSSMSMRFPSKSGAQLHLTILSPACKLRVDWSWNHFCEKQRNSGALWQCAETQHPHQMVLHEHANLSMIPPSNLLANLPWTII